MSPSITAVVVPKWGLEMTEGTVSSWLKQPGDMVARGEPLIEIESEKIVNSLDAPADGVLRRILLDAGSIAAVGTLIGVIADAAASDEDIERFIRGYRPPDTGDAPAAYASAAAPAVAPAPAPTTVVPSSGALPDAATATDTGTVRVSPPVRRLAESLGVSLAGLRGSGPNGRILQEDVERAAARQRAARRRRPSAPLRSPPRRRASSPGAPRGAPSPSGCRTRRATSRTSIS
jgi:pyruvate dehydrogenase E2 component (dihydrolipoamide acetyltransferase)